MRTSAIFTDMECLRCHRYIFHYVLFITLATTQVGHADTAMGFNGHLLMIVGYCKSTVDESLSFAFDLLCLRATRKQNKTENFELT